MAKASRMDFDLPEEDINFLESLGLKWEAVKEGSIRTVVLYGFPFPQPFTPSAADTYIRIPENYDSGAELDMFFTSPLISRTDGKGIPQFTEAGAFMGRQWQQWSRHRKNDDPMQKWRPGVDNLATHISFIQSTLRIEGGK